MQTSTQFSLICSGAPFNLMNSIQASGTLTVSYSPSILTQAYSISVEGYSVASGESTVLDSFTNQTGNSGSRSISLNGVTFDSFRFFGSWSGAAQQFSVSVSSTTTGNGAPFSAVGGGIANIHQQ